MTVTVFYLNNKGLVIKARDAQKAKEKALAILQEKYPHRRIREWDLVVNY